MYGAVPHFGHNMHLISRGAPKEKREAVCENVTLKSCAAALDEPPHCEKN